MASATDAGWQQQLILGREFDLASFSPVELRPQQQLVIYFEGDGLAWINRSRPSNDPTPITPLALQLAQQHPAPNAVYLARPCQIVTAPYRRNCQQSVWTSAQFSEAVIAATDEAVSVLKQRYQAETLVLVGYSGGGVVAALVAARRADVMQLITVASNLDHHYWTNLHQVTALSDSLNPKDFYQQLASVPQFHLVGAEDKVVPPSVIEHFVSGFKQHTLISTEIVPNFDHHCCWVEQWPSLLAHHALRFTPPIENH